MSKKYIGGVAIETEAEMLERHPADFYPTEQALIDAYLENTKFSVLQQVIREFGKEIIKPKFVADLGAGDGRWGKSVKKLYPWINLVGSDIRSLERPEEFQTFFTLDRGNIHNIIESIEAFRGDILTYGGFNLIVGNPPYSILEDWLDVCFNLVNKENGVVSLLLSLNVLSGIKRYKKYYNNGFPLSRIVVCSTRPSFSENGKTYPGREYGMFEWHFRNGSCLSSCDMGYETSLKTIDFIHYERTKSRN